MNVWHDDDWDGHELPTQSPLVPAFRLALLTVAVVAALWWLL